MSPSSHAASGVFREVFRAPMRSRLASVDPGAAVERALDLGVCGTGGRLDAPPDDLVTALAATATAYGDRAARRLARFAEVPVGAVVWTRSSGGIFHRGELTGGWTYDVDAAAYEVDLVHVRGCAWTTAHEVPDAVLHAFARGGRNFQRIRRA